MHFTKELNLLLKSRYPIIYISTNEELRLEYNINQLLSDEDWNINIWDFVQGYYHNPNDNGKGKRNPLEALDHIDGMKKKFSELSNVFYIFFLIFNNQNNIISLFLL